MTDKSKSSPSDRDARLAQFSIERASDPIFWVDTKGRFYGVNEAACILYGYSRDEFLALKVFDINPGLSPKEWPELWDEIRTEQAFTIESEHRRKNGDLFPVEVSVNYVEFEGESYHCSFIRDITERKQAQEEIASISKFPDENPNPILRLSQDGTILYHNKASAPLLNLWDCRAGESISGPWCPIVEQAFQSGEPQQTEVTVGERIYSLNLAPIVDSGYLNIYALDITERKHIESEQKRARDRTIQHQAALLSLVRGIFQTREAACQRVTQLVADTLEVERVSIWMLDEDKTHLTCLDVYERSKGTHDHGAQLSIEHYPRYFSALSQNLTIAAHDARTDLRTSEFAVGYLDVLGITSMMDSPIFKQGQTVGVLCHEHIGPARVWSLDEQQFGSSIADFVSHTFESLERQRIQEEAYGLMQALGSRVKELTVLHHTARLAQGLVATPQEVVQQLLPLLREAWQYPQITEARISYADIDMATTHFQHTDWMQRAEFATDDGTPGLLEICYLEERPVIDEGPFTNEERKLINSLSEMLRNYFERKRVQGALEERLLFEDLITTISTELINLPISEMDHHITEALKTIGLFVEIERSFVFLISEDGTTFSATHEWYAKGYTPLRDQYQRIPMDAVPWVMEQLRRLKPLHIPRIIELPPEAIVERELFLKFDPTQSAIFIPLVRRGELVGFLGLDSIQKEKTWEEDIVSLLRIVGEIFANAFERKAAEEALHEAHTYLEQRVQDRTSELSDTNTRLQEEITERQRGEKALGVAEQKYHSIVENAVEGIYQSTPEGRFLSVNPALARMYGYASPDELLHSIESIGKQIYVDPHYRDRFVRHLQQHGTVQGFECQVYHRDGTIFWISEHARAVTKDNGSLLYYEGTIQDISSRKEAEEALLLAKEAAESANRAKSEFLANMSHELRTPLNGILGFAQILKGDANLSEDQRSGLDVIHRSGEHLLTLINDILDLSKIEAQKLELSPTAFHFPEFLKTIVEIIKVRVDQAGLSFRYEFPDSLPTEVEGDEKRLRQVLLNLLGNSVKFTDAGQVTLSITTDVPHTLRFHIEDTGIGIAPQHLKDIFLPFQQVADPNRQVEGTGLGLTITDKLVTLMGGTLDVQSTQGQGSCFWFTIPLPSIAQRAPAKTQDLRRIIGVKHGQKRVLIIDDKWENRSVLAHMLKHKGLTIDEASNGQEGLKRAQRHRPDVIFMDLVMPVMDGFATTRALRAMPEFADTVIIALSASVFDYSRQESLNVGCNDFLSKPIRELELLQALETHAGIEWEYEVTTQDGHAALDDMEVMPTPPLDVLQPLYEIAQKGQILEVRKQIDAIDQMGPHYAPFTQELHGFAKAFNMKQLSEFLKPYLGEKV
ncbi:MAG: PAS domain S-box protein [Nitrospirales bacterium]